MKLGTTVLRVVVGVLFMGHGLQKLMGWFGGHGLEATGGAFEGMGLKPGKLHAANAGLSETAGGALFAAGLYTPVGGALLTATMVGAIEHVHKDNGPWVTDQGYEYNLVLLAAVFAVVADGPGTLSLDRVRGSNASGLPLALAQLALGIGGAYGVLKANEAGIIPGSSKTVAPAAPEAVPSADA